MSKSKVNYYLKKSRHYLRASFSWKKNDVLLVSFPKSGNTWVRYFWVNYISQGEWGGKEVDFKTLDEIMPSFGLSNFFIPWAYNALPRAVASHWKYGPYFRVPKRVLIIRDPRDVMVSYFHYVNAKRNLPDFNTVSEIIRHPKLGLEAWFKHYKSWRKNANVILRYEDLKNDDVKEFQRMFKELGIPYNLEYLEKAVVASRFDNFKKIEVTKGHSKPKDNKEGFRFARKGTIGDYQNYFDAQDLTYYNRLCSQYNIYLYQ